MYIISSTYYARQAHFFGDEHNRDASSDGVSYVVTMAQPPECNFYDVKFSLSDESGHDFAHRVCIPIYDTRVARLLRLCPRLTWGERTADRDDLARCLIPSIRVTVSDTVSRCLEILLDSMEEVHRQRAEAALLRTALLYGPEDHMMVD